MTLRLLKKKYFQSLYELQKSWVVGLHFRQTTADDYDEVVSIRKHLYDGLDYIPSEYHDLLKHNTGIAGYIGNAMISFMFAAVIDDGQSVLMQSVRVREEYVGRGIFSEKKKYCFNVLARSAERSVYCRTIPSALGRLQKKRALVVFQRNAAIFKTTNHTLKRTDLSSDVQLSPMEIVDAKLLEKIFLSRHAKHNLFPENRIVVKCVPYQLVVSNIDHIFNSSAKLFASFTKDEDQKCFHAPSLISATTSMPCECFNAPSLISATTSMPCECFNAPSLISATTSMPCEAGTVIYLDFYGEVNDKELVTAHISKQMSEYLNTGDERLVLYVTYGKEHHIGTVQRLLSMYSWELTDSEINYGIEETI